MSPEVDTDRPPETLPAIALVVVALLLLAPHTLGPRLLPSEPLARTVPTIEVSQ